MKNLLVIFFISFLLPATTFAQGNLVPNGNFETFTTCPTGFSQVSNSTGWLSWNTGGTPDYFNSCYMGNGAHRIPATGMGYQMPASGDAYMGIYNDSRNNVNEYLTRQITPLTIGMVYEISMSVSLANRSSGGVNDLSVFFFDVGPTINSGIGVSPIAPKASWTNMVITDTQNWIRLNKTFIADSAYDNIVIGGSLSSTAVTYVPIQINGHTVYYFIDSIVLKGYDSLYIIYNDSSKCSGDTIQVNYFSTKKKQSNNIFTLQLSNSSGSFAAPINIGSASSDTSGVITGVIPINTITGTGYRLRIIASNYADTSENTITFKIGNPAKPSILSNSPLCSGQTLQFYGTIGSGLSYSWSGPNSYTSSQQNPALTSATTAMSGNYILTASIYGCAKADTETVIVHPSLQPITASVQSLICAGDTIKLAATNSSPTGASYGWTGPNSYTANTQNSTIPNAASGMNGDYIVTANLNGCIVKDTVTVAVLPKPSAVTVGSNSPLCAGATLQLTSTASTTGATYAWAGPNSFTANTQNTGITNSTAAATGWYVATVNLNGCTTKDSVFATVHAIPAAPTASYNNPLCVAQTFSLSATSVAGASYSWTGVGGYTANIQNPTRVNMQFGDTGMYNVTATVNGCTSPAGKVRVGINPSPFVVILANPGDSVCTGNPVVFTALPNNHGGTPLYQWYVNNSPVTTGALFNTTALANGDVVRCDMTENTKCSSPYTDASNDITMNVLPWLTPSVTFTANPNRPLSENEFVTFTATSTNAGNNPTYQWKRNGQNVQGATGSVWSANTLNDNDSISVEVISSYKCPQPLKGFANGVRVKILSGVGDVNNIKGLTVYPNPNNGRFVVSGNLEANDEVTIALYNTIGQNVYTKAFKPINKTLSHEVSLPEIAAGIYMVKITQLGQTAVSRFVVD